MSPSRSFVLRMALFYGAYMGLNGVNQPFFPVWLAGRGFEPWQISVAVAAPIFVRLFAQPLAGAFTDRAPSHRFAVLLFTWSAALVFLPAWFFSGFWPIILLTTLSGVLWSSAFLAAEALSLTGVRRLGVDFGRMRLSGSAAFMASSLVAGAVLGAFRSEAIFWLIATLFFVGATVSFTLPGLPRLGATSAAKPLTARAARAVLLQPAFLASIAAGSLIQASHAVLNGFGAIHWRSIGFSGVEIGVLWAAGILAEIAVLSFSGRMWRIFGALGLLVLGGAAGVLRWALFTVEPGFAGFLALQTLHALTFCATLLAVKRVIVTRVADELTGTAQAVANVVQGATLALTTLAAGPLYAALGINAFAAMLLPVGLAIALVVFYRRDISERDMPPSALPANPRDRAAPA